jgi:hypothetical protein
MRVSRQIVAENANAKRAAGSITNARSESVTAGSTQPDEISQNEKRNGTKSPHPTNFSSEN